MACPVTGLRCSDKKALGATTSPVPARWPVSPVAVRVWQIDKHLMQIDRVAVGDSRMVTTAFDELFNCKSAQCSDGSRHEGNARRK